MNPAVGISPQKLVSDYAKLLHTQGWVANHDGNVSIQSTDRERYLASPTALSKRLVEQHEVLTVSLDGQVLAGRRKLFSEWHLHATCYRVRSDVKAVVHAHPPFATALGLARRSVGIPALPEMVVSLGVNIPTLDYAMPKSASQEAALRKALTDGDADAVLLAGNGVIAVGVDIEQAYLRLELVEHYCRILASAQPWGGPTPIPSDDIKKLLDARTKAGLGKAARGA